RSPEAWSGLQTCPQRPRSPTRTQHRPSRRLLRKCRHLVAWSTPLPRRPSGWLVVVGRYHRPIVTKRQQPLETLDLTTQHGGLSLWEHSVIALPRVGQAL